MAWVNLRDDIEEEFTRTAYARSDLAGMRVEHFKETKAQSLREARADAAYRERERVQQAQRRALPEVKLLKKLANRAWYEANPEKVLAARAANTAKRSAARAARRALYLS